MKKMLDPNQDPNNLHRSYFKLSITHDLITSKMRLMELYSTLAYRKGIQSKSINMNSLAQSSGNNSNMGNTCIKFIFELQPCGRQP